MLWQILLSHITLHSGKRSCSQLWKLKKKYIAGSIAKHQGGRYFSFSFGINWQWHSKLAVWLMSIVLFPVCTQWQYTHTKVCFKQYAMTIGIIHVVYGMRYVIVAIVSAALSSQLYLCLPYPKVSWWPVLAFFLLNGLLDTWKYKNIHSITGWKLFSKMRDELEVHCTTN